MDSSPESNTLGYYEKKQIKSTVNQLVGKWKCYHRELEDGTTTSTNMDGKEFYYSCQGLIIELKSDFTGTESMGGLNFKYKKNDSNLTLGMRKYIIEKLIKTELVIKEYDPKGLNFSVFRQKFRKVE